MEDILGFVIVIIGLIASAVSAAKKKQTKTEFPPVTQPQKASTASAPTSMASMLPTSREGSASPLQPTVHAHLAPDCPTHDQPGSLGAVSTEGKDPCHEEQLTTRHDLPAEADAATGITLDWNGESLVKAFVMQEVLTRPSARTSTCQRRAR